MSKIEKAREFAIKNLSSDEFPDINNDEFRDEPQLKAITDCMVLFARKHAYAQNIAIRNKAIIIKDKNYTGGEYPPEHIIDMDSIINAYPLDNIC